MSLQQELLIDLLQEVNRGFGEHMRDILAKHKLPILTMIITRQIKSEPGITISDLARRTSIAKSHISNIIEELSRRGLVEKRTDPLDHRILRLFLSNAATNHLGLVREEIKRRISCLVVGLSDTRTKELIEGLREIQAALEQAKTEEKSNEYHKT